MKPDLLAFFCFLAQHLVRFVPELGACVRVLLVLFVGSVLASGRCVVS